MSPTPVTAREAVPGRIRDALPADSPLPTAVPAQFAVARDYLTARQTTW